ncbi:DoxX family protein [Plantactinospora sonchi]|uniref:DoxX family protein n=1 Tax=Plantactinospora sonchi TaxID=1544735 RepID=A0ABU7RLP1_9ACTN
MFVGYVVLALLLAVVLAMSGFGKLTRDPKITASLQKAGVPLHWFPPLAGCEIAGAVGLVVGIWLAPLGVAAATGVTLYFVGAVVAHLRARDLAGLGAPVVVLAVAVATLVLRLAA